MFQPVAKRAAIVVAGPLANFVLAIVIFAGVFMLYGKQTMSARVDQVVPRTAPRQKRASKPGDLVVAIRRPRHRRLHPNAADCQRERGRNTCGSLSSAMDHRSILNANAGAGRGKDIFGNVQRVGILGISAPHGADDIKYQPVAPPHALWMGGRRVADHRRPARSSYIGGVITGRRGGRSVERSDRYRPRCRPSRELQLRCCWSNSTAAISVSIGLLNLFPIPLLDGGHLLFYLIEGVRGRPLSERAQEMGFRIGLAIVLMLMIFATFNDIVHLATS